MIITAIIYGVSGLILGLCIGATLGYLCAEKQHMREFRASLRKIQTILDGINAANKRDEKEK